MSFNDLFVSYVTNNDELIHGGIILLVDQICGTFYHFILCIKQ